MTAYLGADAPVYLLAVLSKGDRANFSHAEVAAIKTVVTAIKQTLKSRRKT